MFITVYKAYLQGLDQRFTIDNETFLLNSAKIVSITKAPIDGYHIVVAEGGVNGVIDEKTFNSLRG